MPLALERPRFNCLIIFKISSHFTVANQSSYSAASHSTGSVTDPGAALSFNLFLFSQKSPDIKANSRIAAPEMYGMLICLKSPDRLFMSVRAFVLNNVLSINKFAEGWLL